MRTSALPSLVEQAIALAMRRIALVARVVGCVGFLALLVETGFPIRGKEAEALAVAVYLGLFAFALEFALRAWTAPSLREFLRPRLFDLAVFALAALAAGLLERTAGPGLGRPLALRILFAAAAAARAVRVLGRVGTLGIRPPLLLAGSFAVLVLLGTLFLLFPRAQAPGRSLPIVDALFTATSACCVTGLSTIDVGSALSVPGQAVLVVLMQAGGIGVATFALLFAAFGRRGLDVRQMLAVRELLSGRWVGEARAILVTILAVALALEAAGAFLLYALVPEPPAGISRFWFAMFHAVSAFCNAGFALPRENLEGFAGAPLVLLVVAALVVVGGLGFTTALDVGRFLRASAARAIHRAGRRPGLPPAVPRASVQMRLAVGTTLLLLLAGGAGLAFLDRSPREGAERLGLAFFHSVSARTAGFSAAPIPEMGDGAHWLLLVLMAIGGAPGSTAGGVKTVTLAVLVAALGAFLRGRDAVEVGRRRLPWGVLNGAVALVSMYALCAFGTTLGLLVTDPGVPLHRSLFESVSALSTVGLSHGITPALSDAGKIVLCAAMFLGRIGPLTLITLLAGRARPRSYDYPEEPISLG